MSDVLYDSPQQPRMTPAVQWLLAANIGVYFLQLTLFRPEQVYSALGLSVGDLPGRGGLVTYMFVHAGCGISRSTCSRCGCSGRGVEQIWGTRSFVYFYLWCGIGGAIAHLLLQRNVRLIGASAAISGVLLAYALRWPDEEVYLFGVIPMKTRWLIVVDGRDQPQWALRPVRRARESAGPRIWAGWLSGGSISGCHRFGGLDNFRRWVSPVPDEPEDAFRRSPEKSAAQS